VVPRCVVIRGWCFAADQSAIPAVRLRAGNLIVLGVSGLPRPDVKTARPEAPSDYTGFVIKGVLPHGRLDLSLEVQLADGSRQVIFSRMVEVRRQWIPRWLGTGNLSELMCFQVPCQMQHPPKALETEKFPSASADPRHRPAFSVVTPSFQQANFLPETIRSVLQQTGISCEYIVQDGGSTDGSVEIVRRYATEQGKKGDEAGQVQTGMHLNSSTLRPEIPVPNHQPASLPKPRLAAWASEPDAGQVDALAKGFAKTSGGSDDLMAWINSDDFYLPGTFAFVADFFARHPEVDVIYGHRLLVDETSREIGRWFLPKHNDEVLRLNDFVPQETMFWRRRIWNKVGGLDPSFQFAMDWDLLLRFEEAGAQIVRVPYFLACFRIHSAQKTSSSLHNTGQREIDLLRARTNGRTLGPGELENSPHLLRYLRRSAFFEFMWKLGIRLS
jgi:glycosyltransferase involved in cell wall biosynthesis